MNMLEEILAFNSAMGCTPQEGYRDLDDALSDTKRLSAAGAVKQARAEVLAAVYDQWAQVSQVLISRIGNAIDHLNDGQIGKARNELIMAEGNIEDCAKRMRTVQPAASALEALLEEARKQTRDENPNRYLARCPDCGANL